jgi:hypothetical protein
MDFIFIVLTSETRPEETSAKNHTQEFSRHRIHFEALTGAITLDAPPTANPNEPLIHDFFPPNTGILEPQPRDWFSRLRPCFRRHATIK